MRPRVLIGGLGNIFMGDDAFGVEVVHRILDRPLADGVRVVDFGTRGYDLAYALMDGYEMSILVDAMPRGGDPGTIYVLEADTAAGAERTAFDPHVMHPQNALALVESFGGRCGRLLIVGCEPSKIDPDEELMGMSAPVTEAIDEAIAAIEGLLLAFFKPAGGPGSPDLSLSQSETIHKGDTP